MKTITISAETEHQAEIQAMMDLINELFIKSITKKQN